MYLMDHSHGWIVARTALDDIDAVIYAARVIDRYLDIVRAAGKDY